MSSGDGGTLQTSFASGQLRISSNFNDALLELRKQANLTRMDIDPSKIIGQTTPESFYAAKFRVSDISLCRKASTTDDSCKENPWSLYNEGTKDMTEYDNFVPPVAASFNGWIDFLDKDSRAKLASSATYSSQHVGQYESLIVHFYRSFIIKAAVPMNNGTTIYTKSSTTFHDNGKPGLGVTYENVADGKMTTAPAEDAVFFLPNGGKTFFLQSKFEITADDVANKVPYKLVLAYDPNGIIKGQGIWKNSTSTQDWLDGQVDNTNGYKIAAPFIEFAPVAARASETIMKETYMLYYAGDSSRTGNLPVQNSAFGVRLTLYYVKEDATQGIRGATTALVYTGDTDNYMNFNPLAGLKRIVANTDGSLNLYSGGSLPVLKNFKRISSKTETGTSSGVICLYGYVNGECSASDKDPSAQKELTMDYTYKFVGSGESEEQYAVPYETPKPAPTETPVF
jgi:hypothetical protein